MVFSFFRKDKQPDANAAKRSPAPAVKKSDGTGARQPAQPPSTAKQSVSIPDAGPNTDMGLDGFSVSEGIEVSEGSVDISSVAEEAAIFYANDRADQAIATLRQHTRDASGQLEIQPWLMLFDLYQLQGMKQAFEELALDFVVKFERSAPVWAGRETGEIEQIKEARPTAGNFFALTGVISGDSESQFQQMQQVVKKAGNLRLDLSKIKGIEASGSRLLLQALQGMRKSGVKIQYIGASNVIGLLKQAIQAGAGENAQYHWLLLLEFDQILGKQDDFEELAVEYAVTFEVSPPSWEPLIEQAEIEEPVMDTSELPVNHVDGYIMSGVISGNSEVVLKGLTEFAQTRADVLIHMAHVTRVDFICMGNFMNTLIQLSTSGKQVVIREPNEMVHTLFRVMGVDQFATIQKKKAR